MGKSETSRYRAKCEERAGDMAVSSSIRGIIIQGRWISRHRYESTGRVLSRNRNVGHSRSQSDTENSVLSSADSRTRQGGTGRDDGGGGGGGGCVGEETEGGGEKEKEREVARRSGH